MKLLHQTLNHTSRMPPLTPAASMARSSFNCECLKKLYHDDTNRSDSNEPAKSITIFITLITTTYEMFRKSILNDESSTDDQKEEAEQEDYRPVSRGAG